ncbi:glycosyltransferase family 2 protein [Phlyctema vagabunda]|uniref:Glycosyltransferase family 2 protein n=1 Tax=Phlyctema vagabunda TaxID=108571 RepID=A0ABR4PCA7_9HELO
MGFFKSRLGKNKQVPTKTSTADVELSASPSQPASISSRDAARQSQFPGGDFRNSIQNLNTIKSMQNEMMAEALNQEQLRRWWSSNNYGEGVVIRCGKGQYVSGPQNLRDEKDGLFEHIAAMNVECAMTLNTRIVQILMSVVDTDYVPLINGNHIQVLPSMRYLRRCAKHQSAAFIRDRQYMVVWDDDAGHINTRIMELEKALMETIWREHDDDVLPEKEVATETVLETVSSRLEDLEAVVEEPRPRMLYSATIVAGTLALLMGALGMGWRTLARQTYTDSYWIRLALLATSPFSFVLGLFMMQTIIVCLFQMFGPVSQMHKNSKAYSAIKPRRIDTDVLPHFTIQMPVYKEGLNAVIRPTIVSLKAAISTYELQGGTANIFINDDGMQLITETEAKARKDFYEMHGIGWVARPKHNPRPKKADESFDESKLFVRKGKFKKASNMNYALMVSNKVEALLETVQRHENWTQPDEEHAYQQCLDQVLLDLEGKAWAEGNIRVGDYILIIDSDTRVPEDCLLDAGSEMEASPEVAILQFSSGVMRVTSSYFEAGISFFTDLIYTAIRFAVASGDVCPFVGHNAILRWSALQQVTFEEDGVDKFWSEAHVSEDFDMALRLQTQGYSIRLAAYQGDGFKEGVSLTVYDELARWEKYAYGCSELIFHPLRFWFTRGPFTPLFRKFIASGMPLPAKITIMAYIGTYYAIGAAWILTVLNYFLAGWFLSVLAKFYLGSFQIYFSIIVVFNALGNVALAVLRYRTSEKGLFPSLFENFKWIFLLSIFLGGISLHVSQALLSHLFEVDMSWGATSKEVEATTIFKELPKILRKFKFTFIFCFLMTGLMIAGATGFPLFWTIRSFNAIWPLGSVVVSHFLLPIALNPALMMFSW